MSICSATLALSLGAPGIALAQAPTGNVTVVKIIDVLSNVSFKAWREAGRANHFIIFAVWKDMKSFDDYSGAVTTRAFRQAFQPRLGGPFDERIYIDLK